MRIPHPKMDTGRALEARQPYAKIPRSPEARPAAMFRVAERNPDRHPMLGADLDLGVDNRHVVASPYRPLSR